MGQNQSSQPSTLANTYDQEERLGAGAFGEVFKVRHKTTKRVYALKVIRCQSNEDLASVVGEMKALTKLSHPNILKLHETMCEQKALFSAEVYLVFEYCFTGDLNTRLQYTSPEVLNLKWIRQLAAAVSHLHSKKLVHRDLKPENVLLTFREDVKVGDFGLSRDFVAMKRKDETWEAYYMKDGCGTLIYLAPEVLSDHFTEKADVFALGILFYAIEERCFLETDGKKYYGTFVCKADGSKVPLGLEMFNDKTGLSVSFTKTDRRLASIIGSALLYEQKKRPDAATIKKQLQDYIKNKA